MMRMLRSVFEKRYYNVRLVNIIAAGVLAAVALGLYMAKIKAAEARETITVLRAKLLEDRRATSVLRAEIAHLEEPDRLKYLAQTYLGLTPREARQEPGADKLVETIEKAQGVEKKPEAVSPPPVQVASEPEQDGAEH